MAPVFRRRIILTISLLAASFGLAISALLFDLSKITLELVLANADKILLAFIGLIILTSGNLVLRWIRWHYLIRHTIINLPVKDSLKLYMSTIPTFATPFYLGEIIRTGLLVRNKPQYGPTIVAIWLIDRLSDFFAFILFFIVTQSQWRANFAITGLLLAFLIYILYHKIALKAQRTTGTYSFIGFVFISGILAWSLPVIGLKITLLFLNIPISWSSTAETFLGATLLGGVTGIPLGFGVTGVSMVALLRSSGVGLDLAVVVAAIFRAGTTWFATSFGLFNLFIWRKHLVSLLLPARGHQSANHFDEIAPIYEDNIPAHIRDRLLIRKVALIKPWLSELEISGNLKGLDIGCGQGWHAGEFAKFPNYAMTATDLSIGQLNEARSYALNQRVDIDFLLANGGILPIQSDYFDFSYSINVFHHVPNRQFQREIFQEIVRVMKPGGVFFLQEINTANPIYKFYMDYIFPLVKDIDDGTELWIRPDALPNILGAKWLQKVVYYNFLPDFTPQRFVKKLSKVELYLENSAVRTGSSHYIAGLIKDA